MNNEVDLSNYPHKITITVRSYEVDFQGVVNNATYLNYLELARIEYRKAMGVKLYKDGRFSDGLLFFVVNNSIDYLEPAFFDDKLKIYTRISFIKNSSIGFEHVIIKEGSERIIAKAKGIIVNVDVKTNQPTSIPEDVRKKIKEFDPAVEFIN
ncbi:MAG: acyl-CoA thioesterase [Ignavibacteria bacterium]|nr:acyl-CoA thioesterase [Ignavibacteria bacterium]